MLASELENTEMVLTDTFLDSFTDGLPKGKVIELWGKYSSGKTTLAMQIVAALQRQGMKGAWAAVEGYDPKYASFRGIDNSQLELVAYETGEEILDDIIEKVRSQKYDFVVVDSLGALTTKAELEKSVGEITMAGQSKIIARFLRNIAPLHTMGNKTMVICTNQQTMNFLTGRAMPRGGEGLGHFKDLSLHLSPLGLWLKQGEQFVGKKIKVVVDKSKIFGVDERKTIETEFFWQDGFSAKGNLLEMALAREIITKTGNTYFFKEQKLGTKSKVLDWIKENQETIKNLLI